MDKIRGETQNTTQSERNSSKTPIEKSQEEAKLIPLTYKQMTAYFPGIVQGLQLKMW